MTLTISVKQLGKKHPILQDNVIVLATTSKVVTVTQLLELVVAQQIDQFSKLSFEIDNEDKTHLPNDHYLPILLDSGKMSFGAIYNHNLPDLKKAQETAIQAFEDGMFAVFYGDDTLETLEQTIDLEENKILTFIRLTFLAGSYW